ncbi:uncharacterized protein LOC110331241 [Mus pahari]|uniref:uncharacterized protein LOC110331241 n=1 Tax=Mus pahari TaxID=10093 RepID=UPI000A3102A3|nr:uncharacterized protein LOC110331241 [Mus pahari]
MPVAQQQQPKPNIQRGPGRRLQQPRARATPNHCSSCGGGDRYVLGRMLWAHIPSFPTRHISFSQQFSNADLLAVKGKLAFSFLASQNFFPTEAKGLVPVFKPNRDIAHQSPAKPWYLAWSLCEFPKLRVATVWVEAFMVREQCHLHTAGPTHQVSGTPKILKSGMLCCEFLSALKRNHRFDRIKTEVRRRQDQAGHKDQLWNCGSQKLSGLSTEILLFPLRKIRRRTKVLF